jgi:hypothetical protein
MSLDQQMQARELLQHPCRPIRPGQLRRNGPEQIRNTRGLGINHPGRDPVDLGITSVLQTRQAGPNPVMNPAVELVKASRHPLRSQRSSPCGGLWI